MLAGFTYSNNFKVVLDTCVLLKPKLRDLILRLAEAGLFSPVWSNQILDELERNTLKVLTGIAPEDYLPKLLSEMDNAFPDANIGTAPIISSIEEMPHDKDAHVVGAAYVSGAEEIVTYNLRDFPSEIIGKRAIHPDEFLDNIFDRDPAKFLDVIDLFINRLFPNDRDDLLLWLQALELHTTAESIKKTWIR